jgi:hypothetical protein
MGSNRCVETKTSAPRASVLSRPAGEHVPGRAPTRGPSAHSFGSISVRPSSVTANGAKISASGSGKITFTYVPEASDKSTKIVFIQVMQELLDGTPRKPSELNPAFASQDADTTGTKYHVDYVTGEKDPYYNGDDAGDIGTQGDALAKTNASSYDEPNKRDDTFPAGTSKVRWEFRTSAFSAAGADAGTWYGFVDWVYEKEKGKAATTKVGGTMTGHPGVVYLEAIDLWNKNHGFRMPKASP